MAAPPLLQRKVSRRVDSLFDQEEGRRLVEEQAFKKGVLFHEINSNNPCLSCGDKCPGFDLHFWRKICKHCKCSPFAHESHEHADSGVQPISSRVGKLSDELRNATIRVHKKKDELEELKAKSVVKARIKELNKDTVFSWKPQGATQEMAVKFFSEFPLDAVPVTGTEGEHTFHMAQERQMPRHDYEVTFCHNLTQPEVAEFSALLKIKEEAHNLGQVVPAPAGARCCDCAKLLQADKLAVSVPCLPGVVFEPTCFCCTTCREPLAGLNAFVNSGALYCARHFNDLYKARCHACDESIYEPSYAIAENHCWHLKHFCCFQCDKPLNEDPYVPVDGQPHCNTCFQKSFPLSRERANTLSQAAPPLPPRKPSVRPK